MLVYLRDGAAGVPAERIESHASTQDERDRLWREVGVCAQILRDLGVVSIRNLSSTPRSYVGVEGFGVEILGQEKL